MYVKNTINLTQNLCITINMTQYIIDSFNLTILYQNDHFDSIRSRIYQFFINTSNVPLQCTSYTIQCTWVSVRRTMYVYINICISCLRVLHYPRRLLITDHPYISRCPVYISHPSIYTWMHGELLWLHSIWPSFDLRLTLECINRPSRIDHDLDTGTRDLYDRDYSDANAWLILTNCNIDQLFITKHYPHQLPSITTIPTNNHPLPPSPPTTTRYYHPHQAPSFPISPPPTLHYHHPHQPLSLPIPPPATIHYHHHAHTTPTTLSTIPNPYTIFHTISIHHPPPIISHLYHVIPIQKAPIPMPNISHPNFHCPHTITAPPLPTINSSHHPSTLDL